jgi:hypothetical protein
MSRDLADEILASAGAEHQARHGQVVDFPLRSAFLKNTAFKPAKGTEAPAPVSWLMWGIIGLSMMIGIFFWEQIGAGASWLHLEARERVYADLGREVCKQPLLTVPEYTCEAGALDCFTVPQEVVIKRYEEQARAHNLWQAERCVPLMD